MPELTIQSLILDEKPADAASVAASPKPKQAPVIEEVLHDAVGLDFAVRKSTKSSSMLLVCIATQDQYYIKNERTGVIKPLTASALTGWMRNVARGDANHALAGTWARNLDFDDPAHRSHFVDLVRTHRMLDALSCGWMPTGNVTEYPCYVEPLADLKCARPATARLMLAHVPKTRYSAAEYANAFVNLVAIEAAFGDDAARAAWADEGLLPLITRVDDVAMRLSQDLTVEVVGDRYWEYRRGMSTRERVDHVGRPGTIRYDYRRWRDYIVEESERQGFIGDRDLADFYHTWEDTLEMELALTGEVRDKYPKHLLSKHQVLSTTTRERKRAEDDAAFARTVEAMRELRFDDKRYDWVATTPESTDDMCDEAAQQSNCLASYVGRVARGDSAIVFLRRRADPSRSWVTIEVRDGRIVQALLRNNRRPDEEAFNAINAYADEKDLVYRG